jgi:flagellar basal-body rod protein FlgC
VDIYGIVGSALTAQRLRLDTISSNLANVQTTRGPDGSLQPYKRKQVVFTPYGDEQSVGQFTSEFNPPTLSRSSNGQISLSGGISNERQQLLGVKVVSISEDNDTPMQRVFDPSHPDADKQGYVTMPNINVVTEMVDMISASRAYEAGVTALSSAKAMEEAALQI